MFILINNHLFLFNIILLLGRSNVGKSTLLNALVGFDQSYVQKALISNKPGETKHLTFYQLGYIVPPASPPIITSNDALPSKNESIHANASDNNVHNNNHEKTKLLAQMKSSSDNSNSKDIKLVKNPALLLVDMPGYGFAFMNEEEKLRCHLLCLDYLASNSCNRNRHKPLKRVIFLLDGRHGIKIADK